MVSAWCSRRLCPTIPMKKPWAIKESSKCSDGHSWSLLSATSSIAWFSTGVYAPQYIPCECSDSYSKWGNYEIDKSIKTKFYKLGAILPLSPNYGYIIEACKHNLRKLKNWFDKAILVYSSKTNLLVMVPILLLSSNHKSNKKIIK